MSEHKYTPGPWRVDTWNGWLLSAENVGIVKFDMNRTLLADAKLIAAAPELLAACELIKKWMLGGQPGPHSDSIVLKQVESKKWMLGGQPGPHSDNVVLDVIEATIKKAKGE